MSVSYYIPGLYRSRLFFLTLRVDSSFKVARRPCRDKNSFLRNYITQSPQLLLKSVEIFIQQKACLSLRIVLPIACVMKLGPSVVFDDVPICEGNER